MANPDDALSTIIEGLRHCFPGFSCQAVTCAAASEEKLPDFFAYISSLSPFQTRNCLFVAYRFSTNEGYEDSEDIATSQKLLHLLQRMGVENIIVAVGLWSDVAVQQLGSELYRRVLETARDLLESIHTEVVKIRDISRIKAAKRGRKQSLIEFPVIPSEKPEIIAKGTQKRLNRTMEFPSTAGKTERISDSNYEESCDKLQKIAKLISNDGISALKRMAEKQIVISLLQLFLILLKKVLQPFITSDDLLIGKILKSALVQFRPIVLTPNQLGKANSLYQKIESQLRAFPTDSEVHLVIKWAKLALELCKQPTVQSFQRSERQPQVQFVTSTSVKKGHYEAPTQVRNRQFTFDNVRVKPQSRTFEARKSEEKPSGLALLADLILKRKLEESAWDADAPEKTDKLPDLNPELAESLLAARELQLKQERKIERLVHLHLEDIQVKPESLHGISDKEIFQFIDNTDLAQQPTGVLMALASKMRDRRKKRILREENTQEMVSFSALKK